MGVEAIEKIFLSHSHLCTSIDPSDGMRQEKINASARIAKTFRGKR